MEVRRIIGLFGGIRPMARKMSQALGKRVGMMSGFTHLSLVVIVILIVFQPGA